MRKYLYYLLLTLMTLGLGLSACDNDTACGDDSVLYIPLVVTGKDFTSKDVTVIFTTAREAPEEGTILSELQTGDSYVIILDDKVLSEGAIIVTDSVNISFVPKNEGERFEGTYINRVLRFKTGPVTGFVQSGTQGSGNSGNGTSGGTTGTPLGGGGNNGGNGGSTPGGTTAYKVTFNENGGDTEANPSSKTVTSPATTVGCLPAEPTWQGYTFAGWNTGENGNGTPFEKDTPVTGDIIVYAQWTPEGSTWKFVSVGDFHTQAIKEDGTLWAWGSNWYGQLGLGHNAIRSTPEEVLAGTNTRWASASVIGFHTLAFKEDGSLWTWGQNLYGQLGLGDTANRNSPEEVQVPDGGTWASVSAGYFYSMAIKNDGSLWAWGENYYGQLGIGGTEDHDEPTQVGTETNWVSVSAGRSHTLAIKDDGSLWVWGQNLYGQLGLGGTANHDEPTRVGNETNWAFVSAGHYYTLAIKKDGSLWAWGYNNNGQLGIGGIVNHDEPIQVGTETGWASVSAGSCSMAIKDDGSLWAWGQNLYGRLGLGGTEDHDEPMQVGTETGWASVSAWNNHTMAIKNNKTLWTWGDNTYGQLGLDDSVPGTERLLPTRVP